MGGSTAQFLVTVAEVLVTVGTFVLLLTLMAEHRAGVRRHWRRGLLVSLALLALAVPQLASTLFFIDSDAIVSHLGLGGSPLADSQRDGAVMVGVALGAVFTASLRAGWYCLVFCAVSSEWRRLRPESPAMFGGLLTKPRQLWLPFLGGGVAAALSAGLFAALEVEMGSALRALQEWYPRLADSDPGVLALVALPVAVTAVITEELVFRGALLGFFLRILGEGPWGAAWAAVLSSAAWAAVHLSVTDAPGIKFTQIFLLGLVFAALARRWRIEAAMMAHLGLNLMGLVWVVALA